MLSNLGPWCLWLAPVFINAGGTTPCCSDDNANHHAKRKAKSWIAKNCPECDAETHAHRHRHTNGLLS